MEATEAELVARYQRIQSQVNDPEDPEDVLATRRAWYRDAWEFLKERTGPGHWWCTHPAVTAGLGEVIAFYNNRLPVTIWEHMAEQLGQCGDCINSFHSSLAEYEHRLSEAWSGPLLHNFRSLNAKRVADALEHKALPQGADEIPAAGLSALYEVLSHQDLLDDAEVTAMLEVALVALSKAFDLPLNHGGRYPGLYRMLASSNSEVYALVETAVQSLGLFHSVDEVDSALAGLLYRWSGRLQPGCVAALPTADAAQQVLTEQHLAVREHWLEAEPALWRGMEALLQLLALPAMEHVLKTHSGLLDAILHPACQRVAASRFRCISVVAGKLGGAAWQGRSSELDGLIVQLTTSISSEVEPETQNCAMHALRAVTLSLVCGLASGSLSVVDGVAYQASLAAAVTSLTAHQLMCKQVAAHVVMAAGDAGIWQKVVRPALQDSVVEALRHLCSGDMSLSPADAQRLCRVLGPLPKKSAAPQAAAFGYRALEQATAVVIDLTADEDLEQATAPDGLKSSTYHSIHDLTFAQQLSARGPAVESSGSTAALRCPAHGTADWRGLEQWDSGASLNAGEQRTAGQPRQSCRDESIVQQRSQGLMHPWQGAASSVKQRAAGSICQPPISDLFAQAEAARQDGNRKFLTSAAGDPKGRARAHKSRIAALLERDVLSGKTVQPLVAPQLRADHRMGSPIRASTPGAPASQGSAANFVVTARQQWAPAWRLAGAGVLEDRRLFAGAAGAKASLAVAAGPQAPRRLITLSQAPNFLTSSTRGYLKSKPREEYAACKKGLDMNEIEADILTWDYSSIISGSATQTAVADVGSVPLTFSSMRQYAQVFTSLLLEELRASLQQAHEDVGRRAACVKVELLSIQRQSLQHILQFTYPEASDREAALRQQDLVLITRDAAKVGGKPPTMHLLALVVSVEWMQQQAEGSRRQQGPRTHRIACMHVNLPEPASLAPASRLHHARAALLVGSHWHATHLLSCTTHLRQFEALAAAPQLAADLRSALLKPRRSTTTEAPSSLLSCTIPGALREALVSRYNAPQQSAVAACLAGVDRFTLVQGPPGTGKTLCIVAMVSALLLGSGSEIGRDRRSGSHRRVLLCAQTNAACDEMVSRLSQQGFMGVSEEDAPIVIVRVGALKAVHESVRDLHISACAERFGSSDTATQQATEQKSVADSRWQALLDELSDLNAKLAALQQRQEAAGAAATGKTTSAAGAAAALKTLQSRKYAVNVELDSTREERKVAAEAVQRVSKELRQAVLLRAHVVACTLSAAGGELKALLPHDVRFSALIIDEAANALEPATLIPLPLLAPSARIVLVGDPQQLPATVLSCIATAASLAQSLFERLQKAGHPVTLLGLQYRMVDAICKWPSSFFYDSRLRNGRKPAEWKELRFMRRPCFPELAFFDVHEGTERTSSGQGTSLLNLCEAEFASVLFKGFVKYHAAEVGNVAVLSPYKSQVEQLRSAFLARCGRETLLNVDFATVDGYQGKEADVVIFSCVRAHSRSSGVGFLADVRRMNVGLTRARRALWIIGNGFTLTRCEPWNALLTNLQSRRRLLYASQPFEQLLYAEQSKLLQPPPGVAAFKPSPISRRRQATTAASACGLAAATQHNSRLRPSTLPPGNGTMIRDQASLPVLNADAGGQRERESQLQGSRHRSDNKRSTEFKRSTAPCLKKLRHQHKTATMY